MSILNPSLAPAPFADSDLDAAFLADESAPENVPAVVASWVIDSLAAADWAMAKYSEAVAAEAELDRYAAESHARIDAWRAQAGARAERTRNFFESHLKRYAATHRTERAKTLYLPSGSVSSREMGPKVVVADEQAAVAWAKEHCPDAVKTEETILLVPLRKAVTIMARPTGDEWEELAVFTDDGDPVPDGALMVQPRRIEYTVRPA